jgi:hypothetical protein
MSPSSRSLPGSEELSELYKSIGFALAQWQFVEASLGRLLTVLLRNQNGAANSAFFAVDSFRSKMEMVNAAANVGLMMNEPMLNEWNTLFKRLDAHRSTRNNLAHFSVVIRGELKSSKHVYYLEPTWFDLSNLFDDTAPRYHFNDVKNMGYQFDVTSREIETFTKKVEDLFRSV